MLAGFVGYEINEVESLGFYRYKCATRPDDVTGTPVTDEDGNEVNNGDGNGESTDNGGTSTDSNTTDKPLDEDVGNGVTDLSSQSETVDDDSEEDKLSIILIILVCVLVPLVIILGAIVYLFRKNKQNAIAAATVRRLSDIKAKHQELDEKMEAKGAGVVDIFADEKKQGQGILGKAIFDQVPTDEEIKELLRGKTAEEKRILLKEIEKARQAKIHMTYLLEQ